MLLTEDQRPHDVWKSSGEKRPKEVMTWDNVLQLLSR
jgi:hypothetical protein